jgi:acyl-coenzyme A thioesterase 13
MNPILTILKSFEGKQLTQMPSPFANWLHGKLLQADEGKMVVEYSIRPEMCNPMNIAHGGVLASMMDEVMGMIVYALNNKNFYASVNLNIDFLSVAPVNSKVIVKGSLIRKGSKICYLNCEVRNEDDKLLAFSSSNLIETHLERV